MGTLWTQFAVVLTMTQIGPKLIVLLENEKNGSSKEEDLIAML